MAYRHTTPSAVRRSLNNDIGCFPSPLCETQASISDQELLIAAHPAAGNQVNRAYRFFCNNWLLKEGSLLRRLLSHIISLVEF